MVGVNRRTVVTALSIFLVAVILGSVIFTLQGRDKGVVMKGDTTELKIPPIDAVLPASIETATFALGWFWEPDSRYGSIDGVLRTRVGYSGGTTQNPTYYNIGDYAETIQIDFDPTRVSYSELLDVLWDSHEPAYYASDQYRSVIFYHNDEQRIRAVESKLRQEIKRGREVYTAIVPFTRFYMGEDYHQKYYLRSTLWIIEEYQAIYPDLNDFINSTAVARVNGFAGGDGNAESLKKLLLVLGLSERASQRLKDIVGYNDSLEACPSGVETGAGS